MIYLIPAICAVVWHRFLISEGDVFSFIPKLLLPLPKKLIKPYVLCELCLAGQISLVTQVVISFNFVYTNWIDAVIHFSPILYSPLISILLSFFLGTAIRYCEEKI